MEKTTKEGPLAGAGQGRRRYSAEEKLRLVAECEAPGSSVSLVAWKHGISPSQLFRCAGGESGLKAGEDVVPASEVQALNAQVRELQRLLGKKTQEAEILRDAVEVAREKKLLSPAALSSLRGIL